jgi:hypothetical protein
MTSEPLPAECAEVRRRLAEGDADRYALDHLAGCQGCSAFAAALVELEAHLARLPQPEPPAGAADRAIARFRAELAAQGSPGTAPVATQPAPLAPPPVGAPQTPAAPPQTPAAPPLTPPSSPPAGTAPPSQAPPARPPRAGHARSRRWRPRLVLASAVAVAAALVVALVIVLGPASAPPAYAAVLREAAAHTGAEKSFRFDLTGAIGLSLRGQTTTVAVSGTGASEFPDRGELTEVGTILGKPLLQQDIVSVGNRVWTLSDGKWVLVVAPPDHASPIDQALEYPAQALEDLTRVGSGYRSLGLTTISGTRVRQIQVTIPGDSFHAFGNIVPERVGRWTVVVAVSQASLVLRRFTITGHGVVTLLGTQLPFSYTLQLTLRDFGVRVSIEPPPGSSPSPQCAPCTPSPAGSPSATAPAGRAGPSSAAPGSSPALNGSSPSSAPPSSPAPTPASSCTPPPPAGSVKTASAAAARKPCTAPSSPATQA